MKNVGLLLLFVSAILGCSKEKLENKTIPQPQFNSSSSWSILPAPQSLDQLVLNSLDSEEEAIDQIMLVWAKALSAMYCESTFMDDIVGEVDSFASFELDNFLQNHPIYYPIADSTFTANGYDLMIILSNGMPRQGEVYEFSIFIPNVFSPNVSKDLKPIIGIGTDIEDFDDNQYDYIPGLKIEGCKDYAELIIGSSYENEDLNDLDELLIITGVRNVNGVYRFVDFNSFGNYNPNFTQVSNSSCEKGLEYRLTVGKISQRFEKDRRSEWWYSYSTRKDAITGWGHVPEPFKIMKVHKNDVGKVYNNLGITFIAYDPLIPFAHFWLFSGQATVTPQGALQGYDLFGITFERDWWSDWKVIESIDPDNNTVYVYAQMKWSSEIYSEYKIAPTDWCNNSYARYDKNGYTYIKCGQ